MRSLKIVLSHPGTGAFVQQSARALFEADLLAAYWTTFVDQPEATWRRALVGISSSLGIRADQELQRRAITEFPRDLLRCVPFWEIIRTLAARMRLDPRLVDLIWEKEIVSFDRRVAKKALNEVDGIYGYEFSALASFLEAKRRGLACIYEVPSPEHEYVEGLIQQQIEQFPELASDARPYFLKRQAARTARRRHEWNLADVIIVNSNFTRNTYEAAGLDVSKVQVIPLGAPPVCQENNVGDNRCEPLKVLWAGTFSIRKGGHYLLAAWRKLAPNHKAVLEIFGANELPDTLTSNLPPSIKMSPTVPYAALSKHYQSADVLVFPTLCDGFGLVVTEALAHGLPVIATTRAGAADLIRHEQNGLVVPPADSAALAGALEWCLTHRSQLRSMRRAALETAKRWQWQDFRRELARNVIDDLRSAGHSV